MLQFFKNKFNLKYEGKEKSIIRLILYINMLKKILRYIILKLFRNII